MHSHFWFLLCSVGLVSCLPAAWPGSFYATLKDTLPQKEYGQAQQGVEQWYDFNNSPPRQRFNRFLIKSGPGHWFAKNESEYWIGNTLWIYDYDNTSCVKLDMGFGIPIPTWFRTSEAAAGPSQWLLNLEGEYHFYQYSITPSPVTPFNYYAHNDTGLPFRLFAPGGGPSNTPETVNEWTSVKIQPTPDSVFVLPTGFNCIPAGGVEDNLHLVSPHLHTWYLIAKHLNTVQEKVEQN